MRIPSLLSLLVAAGTALFIWWSYIHGSQDALVFQDAVRTGFIACVVLSVFSLFDLISSIIDNDPFNLSPTKKQISAIHRAIRSLPPHATFSDPHRITPLPFPSPLPRPEFFNPAKSQGGVRMFQFFGRHIFASLLEEVQNPDFLSDRPHLYLFGPEGAGKSHLLAALVCHLVRDKKRVIYIPDCRRLISEVREYLRRALLFAFSDNLRSCEAIGNAKSTDDLVEFVRGQPFGSIYLVVDQRNALEVRGENRDPRASAKLKVWEYLRVMSTPSVCIFSASGNHQSDQRASRKYTNIKYFSVQAGLSEEEADAWFTLHSTSLPSLSEENRTFVKEITGCVPLLLHSLLQFKDKPFNKATFLRSKELVNVQQDINDFYDRTLENLSEEGRKRCFDLMHACLLQTRSPPLFDNGLVDLRYFYLDGAEDAHCSSGMAFQTLMSIYRKERFRTANDGSP